MRLKSLLMLAAALAPVMPESEDDFDPKDCDGCTFRETAEPAVKAWLRGKPTDAAARIALFAAVSPDCPQPVHQDRSDEKNRAKKGREM